MSRATNQPTDTRRTGTRRSRPRRGPLVVAVLGKGGSAKTTSTAALGDCLAREHGRRVDLIDLDAQASLTSWLLPKLDTAAAADDVLEGHTDLDAVLHPLRDGLWIVPASNGLAAVEPTLRADALQRHVLEHVDADVVVIDTPAIRPLGPGAVILRSVLAAADVVVAPFRSTVIDLDALDETLSQVRAHVETTKRALPVLLLPTMTTRDGSADLVTRALRVGGQQVLTGIPGSSWAAKAAAARTLIADRAPATSPLVLAYAEAGADLNDVLATIGGAR